MTIQINRLGHAGILVSDLAASLKFYTQILGCKVNNQLPPGSEGDGVHTYFPGVGDVHHAVVISRSPGGSGCFLPGRPIEAAGAAASL